MRGGAQHAVLPIRSWEACQKIGEIEELLIADRVEHFRHRWVIAASRIALIRAQRLHEVVLTLASQPRHLLGAFSKPLGSLSCGIGSLSSGVANGGAGGAVGCGDG